MKKLQFDLILATDENNLLKDKHQTSKNKGISPSNESIKYNS